MIIYTSEAGNDGAGEYEERSCEQPIGDGRDREHARQKGLFAVRGE